MTPMDAHDVLRRCSMPPIAAIACRTISPLRSASPLAADTTLWAAPTTWAVFFTVPVIWSTAAAVAPSFVAWPSVRVDNSSIAPEI